MSFLYKRLLVALDGSELAEQILPHAQQMAKAFEAELVLFRVAREVQPELDYGVLADRFIHTPQRHMPADPYDDPRQRHVLKEVEQALNRLSHDLGNEGIKTEIIIKVGDHPAEKIIDYATHNQIDMILMSTHGRTGLAHLVYGSVAEAVLHKAPCPVFLLRSVIP